MSWLITAVSIGVVLGAALIPMLDQTLFSSWAWLLVAVAIICIVLLKRSVIFVPLIVLAGVLLGLWRGSVLATELTAYDSVIDQNASVSGRVFEDPDSGTHRDIRVRIANVKIDDRAVGGKMWVSISTNHGKVDIKRGDIVSVTGFVQKGFGNFGAVIYRAKLTSVQRPEPGDVARQARDWFADNVQRAIDEPQSSLGLGYLLGQKSVLPHDLEQALVLTGLTHVVVASGYNLTILVRLARRLFVRISKYLAALSATIMIVSFVAVTGASPSMSRAGIVAGLSLAAWYYGRKFHPLVLLPFVAAVTVLIDPSYAWGDLGWLLSFAAFAGVMILAPLLQAYFYGDKKPGLIRQIAGETISASIVTLPVLMAAFGQISNVAIVANLAVLPLVPLAMLLTFIAGIGSMLLPSFAQLIGLPAELLLSYMVTVIYYFANLPWAQADVEVSAWIAWLLYVIIAGACIYLWRATKYNLRNSNLVE